MTDFFKNETDDNDEPIIERRMPPQLKEAIFQLVDKRSNKKLRDFCIESSIPLDPEERQDFFHWLKNFRKYGNKFIAICFTIGALGIIGLILALKKLYGF